MRNIVNHGPRFVALLLLLPILVFVASLFLDIRQTVAQVQKYDYTGPDFDIPTCESITGLTAPPCTNGSITASFTFDGVADGYTGNVPLSQVSSWNMNASGVGSMSNGSAGVTL